MHRCVRSMITLQVVRCIDARQVRDQEGHSACTRDGRHRLHRELSAWGDSVPYRLRSLWPRGLTGSRMEAARTVRRPAYQGNDITRRVAARDDGKSPLPTPVTGVFGYTEGWALTRVESGTRLVGPGHGDPRGAAREARRCFCCVFERSCPAAIRT